MDQDDERILKVLKKITDSLSLSNLNKMKNVLLSVAQDLYFTPSICSIVVSTLYAISKSISKINLNENKAIKGRNSKLFSYFYEQLILHVRLIYFFSLVKFF